MKPEKLICNALSNSLRDVRQKLGLDDALKLRLLIGVSGGEDSSVLLHALSESKERLNCDLVVCHLDHGLREESAGDRRFVCNLAGNYGLECLSDLAPDRSGNENIEAWARRVRYEFFEQCRKRSGAELVLTAHHKDDQAETVLWRFLSGRLATCAQAIRRFDSQRRVLRPLLDIDKSTISQYCREHGLEFAYDHTNDDCSRTRNQLRHKLLPLLKRDYNPDLAQALQLIEQRLAEDESYIDNELNRLKQTLGESVGVAELRSLPRALAWRLVRELAREQVGSAADQVGYRAYAKLLTYSAREFSGQSFIELGHGLCCELNPRQALCFSLYDASRANPRSETEAESASARLTIPGSITRYYEGLSQARLTARDIDCQLESFGPANAKQLAESGDPLTSARAFFDLNSLGVSELEVRERSQGDIMRVWKRGQRKVKKLLQEQRLILTLRDRIPIVELGGNILWIPGIARSDRAPVETNSSTVVELLYSRSSE